MAGNTPKPEMDKYKRELSIDLLNLSKDIGLEWEGLGIHLGFNKSQIDKFKTDASSTSTAIFNMLEAWVSACVGKVNHREELSQALAGVDRQDLAHQLFPDLPTRTSQEETQPANH